MGQKNLTGTNPSECPQEETSDTVNKKKPPGHEGAVEGWKDSNLGAINSENT